MFKILRSALPLSQYKIHSSPQVCPLRVCELPKLSESSLARWGGATPLKLYDFGPPILPGPNDPMPYPDDLYGAEWRTIVYQIYDHVTKEGRNMIKVSLNKFEPALPHSWT